MARTTGIEARKERRGLCDLGVLIRPIALPPGRVRYHLISNRQRNSGTSGKWKFRSFRFSA